ncbi:TPM domain-containing protein [Nesterenkonia alba]|uniref:TPM domain-containing protein n=1 Tax=Nesterenkonia alba TaxID=515814 RepID=UPI0003B66200|nr:TPM domain-containing protein [Nesterenkonia alba]
MSFSVVPAAATDDLPHLEEQVSDLAGVLTEEEIAEIESAYSGIAEETGQVVYVHFVEDLAGEDPDWYAVEVAIESGLGVNSPLLVVSIEDEAWAVSAAEEAEITEADLEAMTADDVVAHLSAEDWAEAALAFGEGVEELATGEQDLTEGAEPAGEPGAGVATALVIVMLISLVVLAVGGGLLWYFLRRGKQQGQQDGSIPPGGVQQLPMEELSARSGQALVEIDDALRSSEEELGFARAQFGLQATDPFQKALTQAQQKARMAFALRQQLDEQQITTEDEQRATHARILELSDDVAETLTEQAEHFEQMRNLLQRLPQALREVEQRAEESSARIQSARARLAHLQSRYSPQAVTSVAENPEQAEELLDSARQAVEEGRASLKAEDRETAVTHVQIAEEAVGQAATLLQDVEEAGSLLDESYTALDDAIDSLAEDLQEAARLAPRDDAVLAARDNAQRALRVARDTRQQQGDPVAALRDLDDAETQLDTALAPARERVEAQRRAETLRQRRTDRVAEKLRMVEHFVSTHRGSVGQPARTRLAEAERLFAEARSLQDPQQAVELLSRAERLADEAHDLAQQDNTQFRSAPARYPGPMPGAGAPRGGNAMGNMAMGLLIGGLLGSGGGSRRHRGGWGGGLSTSRPSGGFSGGRSRGTSGRGFSAPRARRSRSGGFGGGGSRRGRSGGFGGGSRGGRRGRF